MHRLSKTRAVLSTVACALLALSASGTAAATEPVSPGPTAPHAADGIPFSPYIDITFQHPTLAEVANASGQKEFTLAFALGSSGGCEPTWGGSIPVDDSRIVGEVNDLEDLGGDVIVATGGAAGPYLESVCGSADALLAAYERVLDAVGSNHLDVDVEASIPSDTVNTALARLQAERGTSVTYTLRMQSDTYGLTPAAVALLDNAKEHGVSVMVNPMTMDYPTSGGTQGDSAINAAHAVLEQMATIWPDTSTADLKSMLSITPMIGVNDTGQVFTTADAHTLVDWANANHIGRLGFWSAGRDNGGCPGDVSPTCSGVKQSDYEFTSIFQGFTG